MAERTTEFDFDGTTYRQHEHYFVARLVEGADVATSPAAHTELETRAVLGWRWWPEPDLAATVESCTPAGWPRG